MGAESRAAATVETHNGFMGFGIHPDGIHRAGFGAGPTPDTQALFHLHAASGPLGKSACRADGGTWRRVARKTQLSVKPRAEAPGTPDAYSRMPPGKASVDQPRARQGARIASDAPFHAGSPKNFHRWALLPVEKPPDGLALLRRQFVPSLNVGLDPSPVFRRDLLPLPVTLPVELLVLGRKLSVFFEAVS